MARKAIFKELLKEKDVMIGTNDGLCEPEITEWLANAGLDFLFYDLEHSGRTIEALRPCYLAAMAYNIPVLTRVRDIEQGLIEQALDAGSQGVLVPTVETAEQAKLIVQAARYAPLGTRGFHTTVANSRWMNDYDIRKHKEIANRDVFVCLLIESPMGIENLDEIIEVEGIDCIHFGPGDLSARMGTTPFDDRVTEIFLDATRKISAKGIHVMPVASPENAMDYYKAGARMFISNVLTAPMITDSFHNWKLEMRKAMKLSV